MDRRDKERRIPPILWFVLLSVLFHHAVLVSVVKVPDLSRTRVTEVTYHEVASPDEEEEPEEEPELLPVVEPTLDEALLSEMEVDDEKSTPKKKRDKKKIEELLEEPEEEPEKKEEEPDPEEEPEEPQITLMEIEGLHFVDIQNNETDEPPPDAEYFAPINSQVEEETRAPNTNMEEDQLQSASESEGDPAEETGNAEESLAAHLVEDDPEPTKDSPETVEPEDPAYADTTPAPAASQSPDQEGSVAEKSPQVDPQKPVPLTVDTAPPIEIAKADDGIIVDPETGEQVPTWKEAKEAQEKKGGKKKGPGAKIAETDLTYSQIDGIFGAEMEEMQESWKEAKKNKQKGGFTEDVDKVFSQLENFIPDVKPGNQTQLNAAYHPFAEYITAFHRKLHPQWGDGFVASLASKPNGDPLNDMSLWVKVEFVVLGDGSIDKVTVVRSSGNLVYDVAAIDAIYAGQPYPPPPEVIKSWNGKVYMRWGMYRNHSQCGVWNAEPYILAAPKGKKKKVKPPEEVQPPAGDE